MEIVLIVILCLLGLLFLYFVYCFLMVFLINRKIFGVRGKDPENPCYLRYDDYLDEIDSTPYVTGYYGKSICGYIYRAKDTKIPTKGFIILSHGLFGTHVQYFMDIYFLTAAGYEVLAYDQYGVGESDGNSQEFLAHGIYVMENVIRDVFANDIHHGLPVFLYGHSWGAYSAVGAMRDYDKLSGVIARGGPIDPTISGADLIKLLKPKLYPSIAPFYRLSVFVLLGRKYSISALRGPKKNKKTPVLLLHSKDDTMVPYAHSLADYFIRHPQENVKVVLSDTGGHNSLITDEGNENYKKSVHEYKRLKKEGTEEDLKTFERSLNRRSMYPYRKEIQNEILSFLDEKTKHE